MSAPEMYECYGCGQLKPSCVITTSGSHSGDTSQCMVCRGGTAAEEAAEVEANEEPGERQWWEFHQNLALLLDWLHERDAIDGDVAAVVSFLEKPWKWTPEWEQRRADVRAEARGEQVDRACDARRDEMALRGTR